MWPAFGSKFVVAAAGAAAAVAVVELDSKTTVCRAVGWVAREEGGQVVMLVGDRWTRENVLCAPLDSQNSRSLYKYWCHGDGRWYSL